MSQFYKVKVRFLTLKKTQNKHKINHDLITGTRKQQYMPNTQGNYGCQYLKIIRLISHFNK